MRGQTIQFRNTSAHTLNPPGLDLGPIKPGEVVDVPIELTAATRLDNGARGKSPIERNAPQLQPVDEIFAEVWNRVPAPLPPTSRVVTSKRREAVEPAGIVAARAAAARADAARRAPETAPQDTLAPVSGAVETKPDLAAKLAAARAAMAGSVIP